MERADWALVVAGVSAMFTLGGLIWQFLLYRLSGARIIVRLTPVILTIDHIVVRGHEKGFGYTPIPPEITKNLGEWTVDLAKVQVTNVGRTAVSVDDISLDVSRPWPRWSRGRHTVRGHPVKSDGCSTEERERLEPGDTVCVMFDVWPLIEGLQGRDADIVTVRGSAHPAGRRPRRSPWRRRWRLPMEQRSFIDKAKPAPMLMAYQELWRSLRWDEEQLASLQFTWVRLRQQLETDPSLDPVVASLQESLGPTQYMLGFRVLEAFLGHSPLEPDAPLETTQVPPGGAQD